MPRKLLTLLFFLLLSALLSGCEFSLAADVTPPPSSGPISTQEPAQDPTVASGPNYPLVAPNPAKGGEIYTEKCLPCHGANGMGNGPQSSNLSVPVPPIGQPDLVQDALPARWYSVVTNGNIERFMPPFQSLSDGERWDVVAYVLSMGTSATELESAKELYTANCASCHGESGQGDGPDAAGLSVQPTNFTDQQLMANRSAGDLYQAVRDGKNDAMPAYANSLSEEETWNMAAYLRSLSFSGSSVASTTGSGSEESAPEAVQQPAGAIKGSVSGSLINGSGGNTPRDIEVTLHGLDKMQVVYTTNTTVKPDGTYEFKDIEFVEERVFVATADYGGATYGSDIAIVEPGSNSIELPITVYETTNDPSVLTVDRLHVFFDFSRGDVVQVVQLYVITNPTNKTVVAGSEGSGVVPFTLPEGATNLQFQDGTLNDRYIQTDDGFLDSAAVRPGQGQYQVMYAFDLPYKRKVEIVQDFKLPIDAMIVMTPAEGVKLKSNRLVSGGVRDVQGTQYETFTGNNLPVGETLEYTISGLPGQTGMLGMLNSSTSSTSLVLGLGVLGLVLVGAGVWLYRRNSRVADTIDDDEQQEEFADASFTDADTIMDAILTLDEQYAAGEIPEEAYQARRAELKEQLRGLTHSS